MGKSIISGNETDNAQHCLGLFASSSGIKPNVGNGDSNSALKRCPGLAEFGMPFDYHPIHEKTSALKVADKHHLLFK